MQHWGTFISEVVSMPEPVRCDVCGKLFSSRHLSSHKRLAHARQKLGEATDEQNRMKTILELYKNLSAENKQRVLAQLAALEQAPS
jgi:predicted nucleic acid binding AN1-type Zn finger protein